MSNVSTTTAAIYQAVLDSLNSSGECGVLPPAPPGKSAYEVAVDNGFVGSENQWLDSLQYEQQQEIARLEARIVASEKFTKDNKYAASRLVGTNGGNLVEYTAHGIGGSGLGNNSLIPMLDSNDIDKPTTLRNGVYVVDSPYFDGIHGSKLPFVGHSVFFNYAVGSGAQAVQLVMRRLSNKNTPEFYYRTFDTLAPGVWTKVYTDRNTKLDTNGALAPSSPTIDLYSDRIETNADGARMNPEFVRNGVGDFTIKNTTGLRVNDGWYIKIPNDMNGNPKVAVAIDTDKDGNLSIKTYRRIFSMETFTFIPDLETPLDIPEGRWIDLRFNDLPEEPIEDDVVETEVVDEDPKD